MKKLEVKIALDDFGTGYSYLSYLSRLPLHCMKVDKSFVNNFLKDANDVEIVKAIITLAHAMNLNVIGEGVETREQMAFLQQIGCNEGQGFLFSKPLCVMDIHVFLTNNSGIFQAYVENSIFKLAGEGKANV